MELGAVGQNEYDVLTETTYIDWGIVAMSPPAKPRAQALG